MPLIILAFIIIFSSNQARANISAELRAGIQTDRSQDPLPDGTKLSLGVGYGLGAWVYNLNYSHIGRTEVGNTTVGTRLSTDEFLAWARYHFFKSKNIETYGGVGGGFKIESAKVRLYNETVNEKSVPQWLMGACAGANLPVNKIIGANLELELLNQPGLDFLEVAILLGMSFRF